MNPDTYVIIPVYNESKVVGDVVRKVREKFSNVICVDDGSTDDSATQVKSAGAKLVRHPINLGAGAATQTGIDFALQDPTALYFITFDADGQHHVADALKMLKVLQNEKLDIVLGSRFLGEVQNISAVKRVFLKLAAIFSDRTTGVKLTDPHIGLRVFNRNFANNLKLTLPDFTHASELVHRIGEGNYAYREVPIKVTYTDYTKQKGQPMLNSINIAIDLFFHRITKK